MPEIAGGIRWPGENVVALGNLCKPQQGQFRCLVDAGYQKGMNAALLVEVPFGKGTALVTSLLLAEKSADDPAAATLLDRSLVYLSSLNPRESGSIVPLSPCPGLAARGFAMAGPGAALTPSTVAAIEAPRADWSRVRDRREEIVQHATAGATLYVHDLTPETAPQLGALTGLEIECRPVQPAPRWWLDPSAIGCPKTGHPLTSGLGSFDLN